MPCGGIYPDKPVGRTECLFCGKQKAKHFCEEWDCYIHARCVPEFLKTEEGKIVIYHEHEVVLDFSLDEGQKASGKET